MTQGVTPQRRLPAPGARIIAVCAWLASATAAAAQICGDDGRDYLALAANALDEQRIEIAVRYTESARSLGCRNYEAEYRLGMALLEAGQHEAALGAFDIAQEAAASRASQALALGRYAQTQERLGELQPALDMAQAARRLHPEAPAWLDAFALELDERLASQPFTRERVTRSFSTTTMGRLTPTTIRPAQARQEATEATEAAEARQEATEASSPSLPATRQEAQSLPFRVLFELNSSTIAEDGQAAVRELAEGLADASLSTRSFWLVGHTDERGDANYNMRLSLARADSVYRAVTSLKPELRDRIRVRGAGEDEPLYRNADREIQHRLNRRVEVRIDSG